MKKERMCGECIGMRTGSMPCPHTAGRHWGCNVTSNTVADGCKMLDVPLVVEPPKNMEEFKAKAKKVVGVKE